MLEKERNAFYEEFKNLLVTLEDEDRLADACGYCVTLEQQLEAGSLDEFIADISQYQLDMDYEDDQTGGFTNGHLTLHLLKGRGDHYEGADHYYRINLKSDGRYYGYCMCTPDMEGYDDVHNCCGESCDWAAPAITIEKETHVLTFSFSGKPKDMWKIEENWKGEGDKVRKHQLADQLEAIDETIARLEVDRERIKGKINSLS